MNRYVIKVDGEELINLEGDVWEGRKVFEETKIEEPDYKSINLLVCRNGLWYLAASTSRGAG